MSLNLRLVPIDCKSSFAYKALILFRTDGYLLVLSQSSDHNLTPKNLSMAIVSNKDGRNKPGNGVLMQTAF